MHKKSLSSSFTLLELLIVMAVLAILASILLVVVKPQQIFAKARDSKRTADIAKIDKVIQIALSETSKIPLGTSNIIYLSLPAISGQTNCTGYSLPTPPSGWTYNCAIDPKKTDGTGWIPINLSTISTLNVDSLPQDPLNNTSYYYSYQLNATTTYKVLVSRYEKLAIISCKAIKANCFSCTDGVYTIDPDGPGNNDSFQVYCDMATDNGGWTLVMKLSKNDFCYGSSRWTDNSPLNEANVLHSTLPNSQEYDAKSKAFYLLSDVTQLKFYSSKGNSTIVSFVNDSSPKALMTTNNIAFSAYPDYNSWRNTFGHDRSLAPIFMRAGVAVVPSPCRTNPGVTPSGCGQLCTFCYQAADGSGCPSAVTANDVNSGVGNNAAYCGGGNSVNCSSAGYWSDYGLRVNIWAK